MRPIITDRVAYLSACLSVSHTCQPCKTTEQIEIPLGLYGLGWVQGIMCRMGSRLPWGGTMFWERGAHLQYRDFLPWAVQKQMNRSIRRLDCGLGWAEGSTSSSVFAMWRLLEHAVRKQHNSYSFWVTVCKTVCHNAIGPLSVLPPG